MQSTIQSAKMFYILISIVAVSSLYFVVPSVIVAEESPRTFLTHTGLVIQTTGDVIDPIGYDGEALDFDPDKFMKEFDYGEVTVLDDGTILREYYLSLIHI